MKKASIDNFYAISRMENGRYCDSYGAVFKNLNSFQWKYLDKKFYFVLRNGQELVKLSVFQVITEEHEGIVSFSKELIATISYDGEKAWAKESCKQINEFYKNCQNPELFDTFMALILCRKPYYDDLMGWIENLKQHFYDHQIREIKILLLNLFFNGDERYIPILLAQGSNIMLCDFLVYYYNHPEEEKDYGFLIEAVKEISALLENELDILGSCYKFKYEIGEMFSLAERLRTTYGNSSLDAIASLIKFLSGFKPAWNKEADYKKAYGILKRTCEMKEWFKIFDLNMIIDHMMKAVPNDEKDNRSQSEVCDMLISWLDHHEKI